MRFDIATPVTCRQTPLPVTTRPWQLLQEATMADRVQVVAISNTEINDM